LASTFSNAKKSNSEWWLIMIWIGLGIVGGILIGYFIKQYLTRLEVKFLKEQLQDIQDNQLTHSELSTALGSSELVSLINELNDVLNEQRTVLERQQFQENQLLDDIANISHDLRTPLTALYGYLELLDDTDLSPQERQYYLDIALARAEVLQHLIQNLFFLARLEVNNIELDKETLAIDQLIKEQAATSYQDFQDQKIHLHLNIENVPNIISNKDAVSRIVNNLLNNILEHGTKEAYIDVYKENDTIVTAFRNQIEQGDSIQIEQVFERHYMSRNNRNTSNSGLGLTITKELTEQLGHVISVSLLENEFILEIKWN